MRKKTIKRVYNEFSRPSFAARVWTIILGFSIESEAVNTIKKIGEYELHKKITKKNGFNPYFIGIYKKGKKRFFIKTWEGKIKDFNYHILVNELLINKILHKKFMKGQLRTPQIIEYFSSRNSLSVVFEYIEGTPLNSFSVTKQAEVISFVIDFFKEISKDSLNSRHLKHIEKKDKLFYFTSLHLLTLVSLISSPRNFKLIIKAYLKALINFFDFGKQDLIINHGDLNPDNILISNGKYFILDCGRLSLTVPGYDQAYIELNPIHSKLAAKISSNGAAIGTTFMKIYLSIQNISLKDPVSGKYNYLEGLRRAIA